MTILRYLKLWPLAVSSHCSILHLQRCRKSRLLQQLPPGVSDCCVATPQFARKTCKNRAKIIPLQNRQHDRARKRGGNINYLQKAAAGLLAKDSYWQNCGWKGINPSSKLSTNICNNFKLNVKQAATAACLFSKAKYGVSSQDFESCFQDLRHYFWSSKTSQKYMGTTFIVALKLHTMNDKLPSP